MNDGGSNSGIRLKANQISPLGLATLAIGIMSPALGLFALWGPMQAAAGPIAPLVFLASAGLALPTALSYAYLNAEAPSAGAAFTWLWQSISPACGYLVGLTMTTYFVLAALAQPLLFAIFFHDLLVFCGISANRIWALVVAIPIITLPVMWSAYRGAQASTRLAVGLMAIETAVVVALSLTIIYEQSSIANGINLRPFNPSAVTHGFSGFWTAMLLGILAFCGFDVVSTAAEETNAPREHLPRAIILTVTGIAIFWAINAWIFTLAIPHELVVKYSADGQTAVTPLAEKFWGRGNILVILTAITGICAVYVTGVLGASRIIFAMARHGLMPRSLARLEASGRVPRNALNLVFSAVVVGDIAAIFAFGNGLTAFTWWANALVFFATLTFTAVNIANIFYFRRVAPSRFKIVQNFLVPIVGAISTLFVMYQAFFVALWTSGFETGQSVVYFCVTLFTAFVALVYLINHKWPARLRGAAPLEAQKEGG